MVKVCLAEHFDVLVRCNYYYDELMDAVINDDLTQEKYEDEIIGLCQNLPMAIRWLGLVEESLLSILRVSTDPEPAN
jgi:hypothetical protein